MKDQYKGYSVVRTGCFYNTQPEFEVIGLDHGRGAVRLVECAVCGEYVETTTMYKDNDDSQRHFKCLSAERLAEIKAINNAHDTNSCPTCKNSGCKCRTCQGVLKVPCRYSCRFEPMPETSRFCYEAFEGQNRHRYLPEEVKP